MSYSYWQRPNNKAIEQEVDVFIVGAGLTGLSISYFLSLEKKKCSWLIVDSEEVGNGASGRNAGFLTFGSAHHFAHLANNFDLNQATSIFNFYETNRDLLLEHIIPKESKDLELEMKGSTTLYLKEDQLDFERTIKIIQKSKIEHRVWENKELKKNLGDSTPFHLGIHFEKEGSLNPMKLLQLMVKKIPHFKKNFLGETKVYDWHEDAQGIFVHTSRGFFRTKKLVLAVNGLLSLFQKNQLNVRPVRAQVMAIKFPKRFIQGNFYYPNEKIYFRQNAKGVLIIGGRRTLDEKNENTNVDFMSSLVQNGIEESVRTLLSNGHKESTYNVLQRWSGTMGYSENELPVAMSLPNFKNVYFVGGYSAHGLGMSFLLSKNFVQTLSKTGLAFP